MAVTGGIADQVPTPVMAIDREYNVLFLNQAGASIVGRSADECVGRKCYSLFNTDHCQSSKCQLCQAMKDGQVHTDETVANINGRKIPIRYTGTPLRDESGAITGAVEFVIDISEEAQYRQELDRIMTAANDGDLSIRGDASAFRSDVFRSIINDLNSLLDTVVQPMTGFKSALTQIDRGSNQVASSSQSLSEGAAEQAASLEEISAALQEIASQTAQNASNAEDASEAASNAQRNVERGQSEMGELNSAMNAIKASSSEISKIIKVIDEIAFQTNLLALNAAVEAARAGEAGKGFAVVAEEVRNLAQRSAEAAKNTSAMIEEAAKRSDNGVSIVQRVDGVLAEITDAATTVNDIIGQIAAASSEQAQGVDQVNQGIAQLDAVTQQNAGNSEELASAAQQTASLVASLRDIIGRFDLGSTDDTALTGQQIAGERMGRAASTTARRDRAAGAEPSVAAAQHAIPLDDHELAAF